MCVCGSRLFRITLMVKVLYLVYCDLEIYYDNHLLL